MVFDNLDQYDMVFDNLDQYDMVFDNLDQYYFFLFSDIHLRMLPNCIL